MKRWTILLALAGFGVVALGLARLRLDADVFNLLPTNSPMVEGLKLYQENFGSSRDLILSVRSETPEATVDSVRSLAEALEEAELTRRVIWRSPLADDAAAMAELIAYGWYNQPADRFADMANTLADDRLASTLGRTIERMTTSLRPDEIARLSRDPLALTDLLADLRLPGVGDREDPFASSDGRFRILFVACPFDEGGFWKQRKWVGDVHELIARWREQASPSERPIVRVTGTPAFVSNTGSGLMNDMRFAALGTLAMVAGLFWLAHRNWTPLLWLLALLLLVLTVTLALGSLMLGAINAVSLGFAAILLGLAADYGLILYQEYAVYPERSLADHRTAVAPGILWAGVTTAGAFFMIGRSSLPGVTQLGALVGVGILAASVIMLWAFLPPLIGRSSAGAGGAKAVSRIVKVPTTLRVGPRAAWSVTFLAAGVCGFVLAGRLPTVDYGTESLGPKAGEPKAAFAELRRELGGFDDALWLIVAGSGEGEVAERLDRAEGILAQERTRGALDSYALPNAFWPRPERQRANRPAARALNERLPAVRAAALEAGFTTDSLRLTEGVFGSWARFSMTDGVVWPAEPGLEWVCQQFAGREAGKPLALGRLEASDEATPASLLRLSEELREADAGRMVGWALLSESLLGVMQHDLKRVLIPMAVVLTVLLGIAFRSFGEVALSLVTLGFSLACLLALMALLGWSWNLMNVMALPLLFGAGVDYGIHVQFALRRCGGDLRQVRVTVGRAILLCGASTASGFGTLGLASNAGLASLGRVCAVGIAITTLVSVYLLPVWWRGALGVKRLALSVKR